MAGHHKTDPNTQDQYGLRGSTADCGHCRRNYIYGIYVIAALELFPRRRRLARNPHGLIPGGHCHYLLGVCLERAHCRGSQTDESRLSGRDHARRHRSCGWLLRSTDAIGIQSRSTPWHLHDRAAWLRAGGDHRLVLCTNSRVVVSVPNTVLAPAAIAVFRSVTGAAVFCSRSSMKTQVLWNKRERSAVQHQISIRYC